MWPHLILSMTLVWGKPCLFELLITDWYLFLMLGFFGTGINRALFKMLTEVNIHAVKCTFVVACGLKLSVPFSSIKQAATLLL